MFLSTSVAVTVAPGTPAPLESVMLPRSVPVTACAAARDGTSMSRELNTSEPSSDPHRPLDATSELRRIRTFLLEQVQNGHQPQPVSAAPGILIGNALIVPGVVASDSRFAVRYSWFAKSCRNR